MRSFTRASSCERPTVALALRGYLAVAPVLPTIAVSFLVLDAYHQLHGTCPHLSIQAFCQALCGIHKVLYRRSFAEQFAVAYDVYLDILHEVDIRVNSALHRDTANWRMLNACAPCLYRLDKEEPLPYDFFASMDGNNSLKLVDDSFRSGQSRRDDRTHRTDLFIAPDEVDKYKDEVANSQKVCDGDNDVHGNVDQDALDIVVEEPCNSKSVCAERWRNAGPEARKKMFSLFAATDIFVSVCRHGHVLAVCDMIRSGELMKYPLTIVAKLVEVYGPDARIKIGYDIGCKFIKTLKNSSLGPSTDGVISCVVPAFHGHSHNRGCQLQWHPMYTNGVGDEDFETCERFFSFSNGAVAGTQMSTAFHRHQGIEGVVGFWDIQKYAATGKFIYNNYRGALQTIASGTRELDIYARDLKTTPADYEQYLKDERAYLRALKVEPPEDKVAIERYKNLDYLIIQQGITGKEIAAIRREYSHAQTRVQGAQQKAARFEELLDLDVRWLPSSTEYKSALEEITLRKYRRAVDNLERLVVQRLFELKKLGMNGYKQRKKIGQALKTRAQAIQTALSVYNREADTLTPPRPQLSWTDVMNMVSLGEFDLLRDARQDIRTQLWTQPSRCDATNTYFKVKRSREEIQRLNVEICRQFSWMIDEHIDHVKAIEEVRESCPTLARELEVRLRYRNTINGDVVRWLVKTSRLAGFSGRLVYGQRLGRDPGRMLGVALPTWAIQVVDDSVPGSQCNGLRGPTEHGDHHSDNDDDNDNDNGSAGVDGEDMEDGDGIPGMGGAGISGRFISFVDGLSDSMDRM
ncbi:hypothetical protein C8Q79DRAFT_912370 [Trametes meyenii]|nr:hypothetical protein C8Q79DRAFT_912370 [Trametes meyenii]